MVTAVDSSVIFDFILRDPAFGLRSREILQSCAAAGRVVACDVVWAEVAGSFPSGAAAQQVLGELGIEFSSLNVDAATMAGVAWKAYRQRGGLRSRVAADFLIGAHASCQADRLLTRNRGFYRSYFKHLSVLDPSRTK